MPSLDDLCNHSALVMVCPLVLLLLLLWMLLARAYVLLCVSKMRFLLALEFICFDLRAV